MTEKLSRDEFVKQTVSSTIATYLQKYVAPWTTAEVQAICVNDAQKLADQLYGTLDGTPRTEIIGREGLATVGSFADRGDVVPRFQMPPPNAKSMGASGTRRIRKLGR
jgi:hypothetical protein